MRINANVNSAVYKKLVEYLIEKSDIISVGKYSNDIKNKAIGIIKKTEDCLEVDIIKNYSDDFLEKISEKYKDNKEIFDEKYILEEQNIIKQFTNFSEQERRCFLYDRRKNSIKNELEWLVYDYKTNEWLQKYNENIMHVKCEPSYSTYYLKLNNELKKEVLNRNTLYDWDFPLSVLDIAFFKDGNCLFCSEMHEEMCDLYCSDEKEFNYFKSIGIEFYDLKYVKEGKNGLPYNNYFK